MRPLPHLLPYLVMKPVDGDICECIILDGFRAKAMSNSNDPPNSYHTSDLFIAHPSIPNAWKFIGRSDDRVTLLNGEKVLPLPIEGRIIQDMHVKEAVVFGIDRSVPGLLLFRSQSAKGMTDEDYVEKVWPTIEKANSYSEGFSQISKEMVAVVADDVGYPSTDKGSVKRAQLYYEFRSVIDHTYDRLERGDNQSGQLALTESELEGWIISGFKELGIPIDDAKSDFFAAGVDSLKAIQMRGLIMKSLDLGKNAGKCSSLVVYDCGNTRRLAKFLFNLRVDRTYEEEDELKLMAEMITKYSLLTTRECGVEKPPGKAHVVSSGLEKSGLGV
jgi:Phosphopantetheine attachment site